MPDQKDNLWPYKKSFAFLAIPVIWIFFFILLSLARYYELMGNTLRPEFFIGVLILGLIPLLMVLFDFFSSRGAVLDVKGFKIDFSKINLNKPDVKRDSFGLPDNIGLSGPIISDTSPMQIITALKEASLCEIVVLNLKEGNAWWVTRLLALSAGAVRAGSPGVFVFIGKKNNLPDQFLGWGKPTDILEAILNNKDEYRNRYNRAMQIAGQVSVYSDKSLVPNGMVLSNDVSRYTNRDDYTNLGEAVTEQIILDQMAKFSPPLGSLEKPPDKLSLHRFEELFRPCLYDDTIDLASPNEQQINQLLSCKAAYIALTRKYKFESMMRRDDGEKLILKELFLQSQKDNNN